MTGVDPRTLELELTESAAVESLDVTAAELNELRAVGVRCSIDDFGTGYCGLSYLSRLPIDVLKIDKSFIHAMTVADASIVKAIIALGHSLGLRVVAEGVETQEQLAYLAERGCDEIQGYLFSKPVPAHEFTATAHRTCPRRARTAAGAHRDRRGRSGGHRHPHGAGPVLSEQRVCFCPEIWGR
jgi:EAL domain-containing protein (putative c-di-GMP-specific phosphodiesterase class I)